MPKHWNCFIAGCHSNWANWNVYHHVPKSQIDYYKSWSKTDGIDWTKEHFICSKHWSRPRKNFKHLPDVRMPSELPDAKRRLRDGDARDKRTKKFSHLRRKMIKTKKNSSKDVRVAIHSDEDVTDSKVKDLTQEIETLKKQLEEKDRFYNKRITDLTNDMPIISNPKITGTYPARVFDWDALTDTEVLDFTGICRNDLATIFTCFEPYLHLLKYEGCVDSLSGFRKLSKKNEFLAVITICRHALPFSIASWMLGVSQSTMSRVFEAWVTFGDAIFSMIDLQPSADLIKKSMPSVFKKLGYGYVTLILDATEFRIEKLSDLNLNTLFYSDYKQSHTVKGLVCLCPHGALSKVPDLFPGSITDSDITELTGALNGIKVMEGVLTDKGFAISELAAEKGAEHNRPPMKGDGQFSEGQCKANFDIACLRIHVERWIGYVRNFKILNMVWPCRRLDLLNSVWRFLAHIQTTLTLVKPREYP